MAAVSKNSENLIQCFGGPLAGQMRASTADIIELAGHNKVYHRSYLSTGKQVYEWRERNWESPAVRTIQQAVLNSEKERDRKDMSKSSKRRNNLKSKYHRVGFWSGVLVCLCAMAIHEDWLGRDAYIQHIQDHWVNTKWWYWVVAIFAILLWGIGSYISGENLEKELENCWYTSGENLEKELDYNRAKVENFYDRNFYL